MKKTILGTLVLMAGSAMFSVMAHAYCQKSDSSKGDTLGYCLNKGVTSVFLCGRDAGGDCSMISLSVAGYGTPFLNMNNLNMARNAGLPIKGTPSPIQVQSIEVPLPENIPDQTTVDQTLNMSGGGPCGEDFPCDKEFDDLGF